MLAASPEARRYCDALAADAAKLRSLPHVAAPFDIAAAVVRRIGAAGVVPTPPPPARPARPATAWHALAAFAAAACVVAAVAFTSFRYFATRDQSGVFPAVADKTHAKSKAVPKLDTPRPADPRPEPELIDEGPSVAVKAPIMPEVLVAPPREMSSNGDVLTSGSQPAVDPYQAAIIRVSKSFAFAEFEHAYPRQKFRDEVKKDEVVRLDLFCKDIARGSDALMAALKGKGLAVHIDAYAADRLKRKQSVELVVFAEVLTPAEVAELVEKLADDDLKAEKKKAGSAAFDTIVTIPYLPADLTNLSRLLATTVPQLKMPKPKALPMAKSLEDETAHKVVGDLGKGGAAKTPEKAALVAAYTPANPKPATSAEIKAFMDRRGERKAGTVPVMIVLRTLN